MSENKLRKLTGLFFIIGAILVNIPYTLLIMNFDYPDILRQPTEEILIVELVGVLLDVDSHSFNSTRLGSTRSVMASPVVAWV